jgi:hypothetical protein
MWEDILIPQDGFDINAGASWLDAQLVPPPPVVLSFPTIEITPPQLGNPKETINDTHYELQPLPSTNYWSNDDLNRVEVSVSLEAANPAFFETGIKKSLEEIQKQASQKILEFNALPQSLGILGQIFGENGQSEKARNLLIDWSQGQQFPLVQVSDLDAIGARGAYSYQTQTIYLSKNLFNESQEPSTEIVTVFLEAPHGRARNPLWMKETLSVILLLCLDS